MTPWLYILLGIAIGTLGTLWIEHIISKAPIIEDEQPQREVRL